MERGGMANSRFSKDLIFYYWYTKYEMVNTKIKIFEK